MPVLTPGEQLLETLDTANLKQLLWDLPAQIRDERLKESAARKVVEEVQSRLDLREADLMALVASAKGTDNKPVYGNKEAREAAVEQSKGDDDIYQRLLAELHDAEKVATEAAAQAEFVKNQFSAVRSLAELIANEARLLASK